MPGWDLWEGVRSDLRGSKSSEPGELCVSPAWYRGRLVDVQIRTGAGRTPNCGHWMVYSGRTAAFWEAGRDLFEGLLRGPVGLWILWGGSAVSGRAEHYG